MTLMVLFDSGAWRDAYAFELSGGSEVVDALFVGPYLTCGAGLVYERSPRFRVVSARRVFNNPVLSQSSTAFNTTVSYCAIITCARGCEMA
ncbi:MAG TPA: hypothetical protein VIT23_15930, partial [Terrimicrobiaceae bacterium]